MHDTASNAVTDTWIEGQITCNARNGNDNHSHLALGDIDRNYVWLPFVLPIASDRRDSKIGVRVHHTRQ